MLLKSNEFILNQFRDFFYFFIFRGLRSCSGGWSHSRNDNPPSLNPSSSWKTRTINIMMKRDSLRELRPELRWGPGTVGKVKGTCRQYPPSAVGPTGYDEVNSGENRNHTWTSLSLYVACFAALNAPNVQARLMFLWFGRPSIGRLIGWLVWFLNNEPGGVLCYGLWTHLQGAISSWTRSHQWPILWPSKIIFFFKYQRF